MNPFNVESYDFLIDFKSYYQQLPNVSLEPLYKFKNLQGQYAEDFLRKNCFSKGLFCSTNEENFDSDSILIEGVRQICVFRESKNNQPKDSKLAN